MTDPQPLDLDAIRARADAATPGPWAIVERNGDHIRRKLRGADDQFILGLAALLYPDPADAAFITHARDDVPALLAAYEALRNERNELAVKIEKVKRYAEDRSYHAGTKNNTVSSWRIASDLEAIVGKPASPKAFAEVKRTELDQLEAARADAAREKARADRLLDLLKKQERQW